jgi:hypothetical protein
MFSSCYIQPVRQANITKLIGVVSAVCSWELANSRKEGGNEGRKKQTKQRNKEKKERMENILPNVENSDRRRRLLFPWFVDNPTGKKKKRQTQSGPCKQMSLVSTAFTMKDLWHHGRYHLMSYTQLVAGNKNGLGRYFDLRRHLYREKGKCM